jgi:hypothetical protein
VLGQIEQAYEADFDVQSVRSHQTKKSDKSATSSAKDKDKDKDKEKCIIF